MAKSPKKNWINAAAGLTLVEVLIALAIVSIALTAVIKATAQSIRSNSYLQNKSMALFVAVETINKFRIGMLKVPDEGGKAQGETKMLNKNWYWQTILAKTANAHIKKLHVEVFAGADDLQNDVPPLIYLDTFLYYENQN